MSTKTVLVVEDRDVSRELIRTLLEHTGYNVLEASTGADAVCIAVEKTPDLVLLDLQMPIKDGFQVLKELRASECCRAIPIVALTASAMQGDKERALSDGFTGYLTKPLSLSTIRQELARLLPGD
jgi:two-component system cell cycle response regulator DivK